MEERPPPTRGLRHVALNVRDLDACERFYVELLGMRVEWRPDPESVYLTGGADSLALHRSPGSPSAELPGGAQRLDHVGFVLAAPEDVDAWHRFLARRGVPIEAPPRSHRDGARSFYCRDPEGNRVQLIHHPPLDGR